MNIINRVFIVALCASLGACATTQTGANWSPIIDSQGKSAQDQATDLSACQDFATRQAGAAQQAAAGAIAGALFGALLAAAAGGGYSRNQSAGIGAVSGLAAGAAQGETDQRSVIRKCMAGRGYNVLN